MKHLTKPPEKGTKFYVAKGQGLVDEYVAVGSQFEKATMAAGLLFEHSREGLLEARERSDKGLLPFPGTYWHDDVAALKEFHEQFQRYEIDAATLAEKVQSFVEKYS